MAGHRYSQVGVTENTTDQTHTTCPFAGTLYGDTMPCSEEHRRGIYLLLYSTLLSLTNPRATARSPRRVPRQARRALWAPRMRPWSRRRRRRKACSQISAMRF